jgi:hypothetical protein
LHEPFSSRATGVVDGETMHVDFEPHGFLWLRTSQDAVLSGSGRHDRRGTGT